MSLSNETFFDVPRKPQLMSDGNTIELPILYKDSSNLGAWFQVEMDKAQALLPEPLVAIPNESGCAAVYVGLYEYRDTTVGVYNEVGVGIQCVHSVNQVPGLHIIDLPVTTEIARRGGVEIWGYPKFVADIPIQFDGTNVTCEIIDDAGKQVMSLSGDRGDSLPIAPMDLLTFAGDEALADGSKKNGIVEVRNSFHASNGKGLLLSVGDSDHRMAKNLRSLGLNGAKPLFAMFTDEFQSLLDIAA